MNLRDLLDNLEPAHEDQLDYEVIIRVDVMNIPNLGDDAEPVDVSIEEVAWDHENNKIYIKVPG